MKIVFMGTPEFSVPVLEALVSAGHEVVLAVTQPDREKGRGKEVAMSPVKIAALAHGIPVFQPQRIRLEEDALRAFLTEHPADVGVVVAFGQLLPQSVLDMPKYGCINIHASLLPQYRGAAPIQQAVLDGCAESGVTTMQMDAGLDTGDILLQRKIELAPDETGGSLHDRLSALGAELILETLEQLEAGTLTRTPQAGEATFVGRLDKEMGRIDWKMPAAVIERQVRGMDPWPSAFTFRGGKLLKIWKAETAEWPGGIPANAMPGSVFAAGKNYFDVVTGNGLLRVLKVQPEGKKMMDADAYLRGYPLKEGTLLGV